MTGVYYDGYWLGEKEKPDAVLRPVDLMHLRRIVATNGGGYTIWNMSIESARRLAQRRFIRNKPGNRTRFDLVIHTEEGREWCAKNEEMV